VLVFPHQALWQYSDGDPLNRGVECRLDMKNRYFRPVSRFRCYQQSAAGPWQIGDTHACSSKRRSLMMTGDVDEVFMTRSLNVTYAKDNRTAFNCIWSGKSEAEVTNNRRMRSRYCTQCTVEANWQTRSIARPLCDSRASCFKYILHIYRWRRIIPRCITRLSFSSDCEF